MVSHGQNDNIKSDEDRADHLEDKAVDHKMQAALEPKPRDVAETALSTTFAVPVRKFFVVIWKKI